MDQVVVPSCNTNIEQCENKYIKNKEKKNEYIKNYYFTVVCLCAPFKMLFLSYGAE